MGNRFDSKKDDEFIRAVSQIKKKNNQFPVQKVATHLQQRYKAHMIQSLKKQEMSKSIKKILLQAIETKIKKQQLTSTVAVLNSLKLNNAEQLLKFSITQSKIKQESKNVVVKFNSKVRKIKKPGNIDDLNQFFPYREEDTIEGRIKNAGNFVSRQLTKPYHPFKILCKKFGDILGAYEQHQSQSKSQNQYDMKQDLQRKTAKDFCHFLAVGCLGIYKRWILQYTGLDEKKYEKWINSLVLNQIWIGNEAYLLSQIIKVIRKTRIPLKINIQNLTNCSSMGILQPKQFGIDPQFQIQGNYLLSIYQMCLLTEKQKPSLVLKQLQVIKNSICMDIDNYYKLCDTGQIFQINGDNIMGIVAYILSKNAPKINQISQTLLFLKMIYGQAIFYSMDTSSYMYSTIWGALQYLESKEFQVPQSEYKNKVENSFKATTCVQSFISGKSTNDNTNNQQKC